MSVGFVVIPIGEDGLALAELRELAADLQEMLVQRAGIPGLLPFASHWVEDASTVAAIAMRLRTDGHSFPDCAVCP